MIKKYRWKCRVLLIKTPNYKNLKYKKAKAHFFSHRGVAPVYANDNLFINIENNENGNLNCFTSTKDAGMTMKGEAKF